MSLAIRNLFKQYPNGTRALENVSVDVPRGLFGLLGPNGAGKSTLMRILATLQSPDMGSIHFDDKDILADSHGLKKTLGYLPQEFGLYPHVTAEDFLVHFIRLSGYPDKRKSLEMADRLFELTNLKEARKAKLKTFSGGMKQRFGIAIALIGDPKLLILDEPVSGLDPGERANFLNLLNTIGKSSTVLLSTHIVDDVAGNCQNVAIINQGKIAYQGETNKAMTRLEGRLWAGEIERESSDGFEIRHRVVSKKVSAENMSFRVYAETAPDPSFKNVKPSLEDAYFFWLSEPPVNE